MQTSNEYRTISGCMCHGQKLNISKTAANLNLLLQDFHLIIMAHLLCMEVSHLLSLLRHRAVVASVLRVLYAQTRWLGEDLGGWEIMIRGWVEDSIGQLGNP